VDQEIIFEVARLLRSGHIVRAGVDMYFAIKRFKLKLNENL
jgi:hypothetical protein